MPAAGVHSDSIDNLTIVAVHQVNLTLSIEFHNRQHIHRFDASMLAARLPGRAGVVSVFVLLNPNARLWKQIHSVGMIPMHV